MSLLTMRMYPPFLRLEKGTNLNFTVSGVMIPGETLFTKEGYDLQFGVNTIGKVFSPTPAFQCL